MFSKQIVIYLFLIFSLVQLIICPPTLEKNTTSVKSDDLASINNEVPRTSPITTNKPVIQRTQTWLPQKSIVAAQAKPDSSGTFDAGSRILTKLSETTSQTSKKLPRSPESLVVDDKKTTEFLKNIKSLPIIATAATPEIIPSSSNSIVETSKSLSRTQSQSSGAPSVTVPLKAPVASIPYKQSNLAPNPPAGLSVISPESVKIKASQPVEISPMVSRTASKSVETPVVVFQRKPVAPVKVLQQNSATHVIAPTQSNTLPNVSTTTSKLSSGTPKIKVEPPKISSVRSRSLNTPPVKPSGSVSRSLSLTSNQPFKSQKELVSSPNVPVMSTRSVSATYASPKRTPSQNIVSTQPSKSHDDFPERKGTYDMDYNNAETNKGFQKQISKRIPEVIKRPINWASKPAKLAWKFANLIKQKVTGNNVAT